jgi:hypothetical protein
LAKVGVPPDVLTCWSNELIWSSARATTDSRSGLGSAERGRAPCRAANQAATTGSGSLAAAASMLTEPALGLYSSS